MKKFLLSLFVIVLFTGYVLRQRLGGRTEAGTVRQPANTTEPSANQNKTPNAGPDQSPVTNTDRGTSPGRTPAPTSQVPAHQYKNGTYDGSVADAYYGNIQVRATIHNGKLTDVQFLDYPQDRDTSIAINTQAMPYLKSEALQAQSASVDVVSGATDSSFAFRQSLQVALNKAKHG